MNDTTTKTTMRQLLARWAEVEPTLCRLSSLKPENFELLTDPKGRWWLRITEDSLMAIQWATQQAIVARDWSFELSYYSILGSYGAEIDIDSHRSVNRPGSSPAEALLTAYLRALEYGPLEAK